MPDGVIRLLTLPLLPFGVAAALTVVSGLRLGGRRSASLLGLAQTIGFLAGYGMLLGLPARPPVRAQEAIAYVAVLGVLLGMLLPLLPRWADVLQTALLAWPIAIVIWLASRAAFAAPTLVIAALLALFGAAVIGPLAGARQKSPRRSLMLLAAVLGLAVLAAFGRAPVPAELALALAASLAGVLVAGRSLALANSSLVGPTGTALALAGTLALFTGTSKIALLVLALVFAADQLARRLPSRRFLWLESLMFALGCLVPLGLALALARLSSGPLLSP